MSRHDSLTSTPRKTHGILRMRERLRFYASFRVQKPNKGYCRRTYLPANQEYFLHSGKPQGQDMLSARRYLSNRQCSRCIQIHQSAQARRYLPVSRHGHRQTIRVDGSAGRHSQNVVLSMLHQMSDGLQSIQCTASASVHT